MIGCDEKKTRAVTRRVESRIPYCLLPLPCCSLGLIFGLPGETKETIKETYDVLKKLGADGANFNYITPYPGTEFYDYALSKELVKADWSDFSGNSIVMGSEDLTIEELRKISKRVIRKYTMHKLLTDRKYRKQWLRRHF